MRSLAVIVLILSIVPGIYAQGATTSLACTSNAKAWRDYSFLRNKWDANPFDVSTTARPVEGYPLRDKVFSALDTRSPVVRSITPKSGDIPGEAVEFDATVLLRSDTEIFLTWNNEFNKVWLAVVDLENRRVVVTQTFKGVTSIGGEIETLDCR